jgi:CBS-domain-containing membrane protein
MDATRPEAVMLFERYNFRALPITDENYRLLGAVWSRDVRAVTPRLE